MRIQTSAKKRPTVVTPSAKWITFQAGGPYVGVSVRTLENWEQAGCFRTANVIAPGSTRGRKLIDRESLDAFIEGCVGAPATEIVMNTSGKRCNGRKGAAR